MTETRSQTPLRRNLGMALLTLIASAGAMVCCVLPAVMVALGAGAALAGLATAVPQLVWLSEHKAAVFALAATLLAVSGATLLRARTLPCPLDPGLSAACRRLRRASVALWSLAAACTALGAVFAFVLPNLS